MTETHPNAEEISRAQQIMNGFFNRTKHSVLTALISLPIGGALVTKAIDSYNATASQFYIPSGIPNETMLYGAGALLCLGTGLVSIINAIGEAKNTRDMIAAFYRPRYIDERR